MYTNEPPPPPRHAPGPDPEPTPDPDSDSAPRRTIPGPLRIAALASLGAGAIHATCVGTHGDDPADVAKLRRVLDVNVVGLAATLAAFAPSMRAAKRGTLCGIASVAGIRGLPGAGAYSSSKAAAISWLEALRVELRGSGVSVVTICPGYIDTPMTQVNRFRMPFLLTADEAARRIARAIAAKRRVAVIPWQMALVSVGLRAMPGWLYDRIASRAPRKPKDVPV